MDETVKAEIARLHDEEARQNKRIDILEADVRSFQSIAMSVEKLALNMELMLKEQEKQGVRLEALESQPGKAWTNMQRTIFNTLLGAIVTVVVGALIYVVARYVIGG